VDHDLTEVKTADLIHDINADIIRFKVLLPNTKIVWSHILMRRYWHKAWDGYKSKNEELFKPMPICIY
jgi:hypothetical protein